METWRDRIRKVTPYVPGEQPDEKDMVKLNTNENPYPPSPLAERTLKEIQANRLRLYPDPTAQILVKAIADYHGVEESQVFVGVGSDDVLAMSFLTFFNGKEPLLFPDITYSFYDVWAELFGIPYERVPLNDAFEIVPADYQRANGGIVFPNPNAPTGVELPQEGIRTILCENPGSIVIVDEAYVDFGAQTALPLLEEYENLLVVRTFSKSRSMAGMRIGYAIGGKELIRALNDVKYSYNSYTMDTTALALGAAVIRDEAYFRQTLQKILETRAWTQEELRKLGFEIKDSKANFIFASHKDCPASELFAALRSNRIYVRYFNKPRIDNYLRITIGTPQDMEKLVEYLQGYLESKGVS